MRSTIIHVGPHKTGTTYLQAAFRIYRTELAAQGVIFPTAWDQAPNNASHTGLVRALTAQDDLVEPAAIIDDAFRIAGDSGRLLISCEDLSTLNIDPLLRLRSLLAGHHVTIVYYIRRWSDLLPSAWQELAKGGDAHSFPEFLASRLRNPLSHTFNYELRLANLVEVFGQDNLRLVCYSELRDTGRDIFSHFATQFLGWSDAPPPPGALEPNTSLDVFRIELLRRLHMIDRQTSRQPSTTLRISLDRAWNSLDLDPVMTAMAPSRRTLSFNDRSPSLHRLHKELRERLDRITMTPSPANLFFEPRKRDIAYVGDDYLMRPGMVDAVHGIYRQLYTPIAAPPAWRE